MKSYLKITVLAVVAMLLSTANSFAAVDMYLKISGKNVSKVVKLSCVEDKWSASLDGLKAGKYTITLCDATGTALKAKEESQ